MPTPSAAGCTRTWQTWRPVSACPPRPKPSRPATARPLDEAPLIASVTSEFPADGRRGGHLVVLRGYELGHADPLILFRDPSGWGQDHDRVRLSRLAESYSGRCITFKPAVSPATEEHLS